MSTQVKVRLISAAPSCVAVNFISMATRNISERPMKEQSVSCDSFKTKRQTRVGEWAFMLEFSECE